MVVGDREVEASAVRLRQRDGEQKDLPWDEAVAALVAECRPAADACESGDGPPLPHGRGGLSTRRALLVEQQLRLSRLVL